MITISTRDAVVALGTTASLLLAAPAVAQTAIPAPTATSTPLLTTVAPQIQVDKTLIDFGDTHRLTLTGAAGAAVQLFGNGRQIRTVTIPASGQLTWTLQPGDRTLFYAVVDGRQSSSVTVGVRRTVSIGVRQDTGGVYTFTGQMQRAEAGLQVTVARLDSVTKRVAGVASTRTTADGHYEIRTSLPVGVAGYYALTGVNASALQPGRSRLYGLIVNPRPRPAATALAPIAASLAGRTVTLDAGHNGGNASQPAVINARVYAGGGVHKTCNTVGTSTGSGYPEHAFNWDVSRRAAALLRAQGARVVLTRANDVGVGPCIGARAAIGNQAHSDVVVAIHGDGSTRSGARGFHVIAPMSPPVAGSVVAQSDRLAQHMRAAYRRTTGIPYANYIAGGDGLDARRDLGGLNLSTRPVVFVECGNMRNSADAALMATAAGRQRIAAGIAAGISAYLRA